MKFKPVAMHLKRHMVTSENSGNELKLENYNTILFEPDLGLSRNQDLVGPEEITRKCSKE